MSTSADNKASVNQEKKILLRTADGEVFELKKYVAMEIDTVKSFFQEKGVSYETVMPFPKVQSWEMVKVIEYVLHQECRTQGQG